MARQRRRAAAWLRGALAEPLSLEQRQLVDGSYLLRVVSGLELGPGSPRWDAASSLKGDHRPIRPALTRRDR